jgi:hypothetical protein
MPLVFGEVDTPQVRDGSLRGITGPLVKVPLIPASNGVVANYVASAQGTSCTVTPTMTGSDAVGLNHDGSGHLLVMFVSSAATLPAYTAVRTQLFGRIVGVRWRRGNSASIFPFDVIVDGVVYRVDDALTRRDNQSVTAVDGECLAIVATNLADTVHTVEIIVSQQATDSSLSLFGLIAEAGRGYSATPPIPRSGYTPTPTALTATAASIPWTNPVSGLTFNNTDSAQRVITVYGPDGTTVYRTLTLAAGADGQLLFQSPRKLSGWKWKADAVTVVKAFVEHA